MPDTSITGLDQYQPQDGASAHPNDVFVIVDVHNTSMAPSGTDRKVSISQFTDSTNYPCILDVALNPVAQGDLIYRDSAKWAVLTPGTSGYILATQGASANPVWRSQSAVLDGIGSTQGDILYRDASSWGVLAPADTPGHVLASAGVSANPSWVSQSTVLDGIGSTQGDILYRGASGWGVLAPGIASYVLVSGGASANPSWVADPVLVTQIANCVLSGPTTGSPALPTFRALEGNDLPSTGLTITQWAKTVNVVSGSSGAVTLNFTSTGYNEYVVTLPEAAVYADCAITLGTIAVGQTVKVTTVQDGTGNTTVSWPTTNVTVRWAGGTAPEASPGANKADTFVFYCPSSAIGVGGTVALANF